MFPLREQKHNERNNEETSSNNRGQRNTKLKGKSEQENIAGPSRRGNQMQIVIPCGKN